MKNSVKVAAILGALALGCESKKAAECKQVVSIVNESGDMPGKSKALPNAGYFEATDAVVAVASKTEKGLAAISVTTPELKNVVSNYQTMVRAIGQASADMKGALSASAALAKDDRAPQLESARKDLAASKVKLVEYCAKKPSGECKKVNSELPTDAKAADYSAKVRQVAEAFQKAEWKDKAVAELVNTWTKAAVEAVKIAADVQKVREQATSLEMKATHAHGRLMQATQQSNGLTAALNNVCRR